MKNKITLKNLLIAILLFTGTLHAQVGVSGAGTANGSYTTLRSAFTAINTASVTGATITINLTGDTNEGTQSAQLNNGSWSSVVITPVGNRTITGATTAGSGLIFLNGADNVTIDGLNASGNSLTLTNTTVTNSAGSATLRFGNDALNNTIRNCTITGSVTAATSGVVFFGSGSSVGNDNNTITGCTIREAGTNLPVNAIASVVSLAPLPVNDGIIISNNAISNYFSASQSSSGILLNAYNSGWTITGNRLYQSATRTTTTAGINHRAIYINSPAGGGYTIANNIIGYADAAGNGITTYEASVTNYFVGIQLSVNTTLASSIQGNTVSGINHTAAAVSASYPGMFAGISILEGTANVGNLAPNTIGASSGTNAIRLTSTNTETYRFSGIFITAAGTCQVSNNIIGSISTAGAATAAYSLIPLYTAGSANFTVSNNLVGSTASSNSITSGTNGLSSAVCSFYGIYNNATGAASITGNTIQNCSVYGTGASFYNGIFNFAGSGTATISNNLIANATLYSSSTTSNSGFRGIYNEAALENLSITNNTIRNLTAATNWFVRIIDNMGAVTGTITMSNNQLGTATNGLINYTIANPAILRVISNGNAANTATVAIEGNNIYGITHAVAASATHNYIFNGTSTQHQRINNNTFNNLSVATTGNIAFISNNVAVPANGTLEISGNNIVGAFTKPAVGGTVTVYYHDTASNASGTLTHTNNNFSNITATGATALVGWSEQDTGNLMKTITGNTFSNWNAGAINVTPLYVSGTGNNSAVSNNTVSGITAQGVVTGLEIGASGNGQVLTVNSNTITGLSSTGTGNNVYGLTSANNSTASNIYGNTISNLSTTGASSTLSGLRVSGGTGIANVYQNTIFALNGTGSASPSVSGVLVSGGSTVNIYRNKVYDITQGGASTGNAIGISLTGGTSVTAYNNLIGDIKAPQVSSVTGVRGISVNPSTAGAQFNLYFNNIYLNASSSGANFGSAGIYQITTNGSLDIRNNIIVNLSLPSGSGRTVAFLRSAQALNSYSASSNNNLFYAGVPGANNLLYADGSTAAQTLAQLTAAVTPRESSSLTGSPVFVSTTGSSAGFLKPDISNIPTISLINEKGISIPFISTDYEGAVRGTLPDLGAYEINADCTITTTWNGSSWSNGVPSSFNYAAVISGDFSSTGNLTACSLTVSTGTVTINTGHTFTIKNAVAVAGGSLAVANNAALVQIEDAVNTGNVTVRRDSNPLYRLDYTLWSSPVVGQLLRTFSMGTSNNRFYEYKYAFSESRDSFFAGYYAVDPLSTIFNPGKGYLIRMPNSDSTPGYNQGTATITHNGIFTGTPLNGPVNVSTVIDGYNQSDRFLALGNPYASPINVAAFFAQNAPVLDADSGIYFWRKRNDFNATSYAHLTLTGFTVNSAIGGDMAAPGGAFYYTGNSQNGNDFNSGWIISPGQGFFVKLKPGLSENTLVSFTNSMRRNAPATGGQPFFRTQNNVIETSDVSRWWINLTGPNNIFGQVLVGYMPQGTTELDYGYDARLMTDGTDRLYSIEASSSLAIQTRPVFVDTDVVKLGFEVSNPGSYNLAIDHEDGIFDGIQDIYIKDNITGSTVNLSEQPYSFTSDKGIFDNRFEIVYQTEKQLGNQNEQLSNLILVYQNKGIHINSGAIEMTGITIYDIRGTKLFRQSGLTVTEMVIDDLNASSQVLLLQINTANGTVTKKLLYMND